MYVYKKKMKINKWVFLLLLLSISLFYGCGPTACECLKNHNGLYSGGIGLTKKCVDKFGSDIPDNLRGTDEFSRELVKNMKKVVMNNIQLNKALSISR